MKGCVIVFLQKTVGEAMCVNSACCFTSVTSCRHDYIHAMEQEMTVSYRMDDKLALEMCHELGVFLLLKTYQ